MKLYVYRHDGGNHRVVTFRSPGMKIGRESYGRYNYSAVFICDDVDGNKLLSKLENPAHTEWSSENWRNRSANGSAPKEVREAIKDYQNFITDSLEEMFGVADKDILYAIIPFGTGSPDLINSPGAPSASEEGQGGSIKVTSSLIEKKPEEAEKEIEGKIVETKRTRVKKDPNGTGKTGSDGGGNRKRTTRKKNRRVSLDPEGEERSTAWVRKTTYKVPTRKEDGVMYHYLIVHADEDMENCEAYVLLGAASGQSVPASLLEVDGKSCSGNKLAISLKKGKNTFKLRFNDNLQHTLRLVGTEENKKVRNQQKEEDREDENQ